MKISVIIPNYNGRKLLKDCLESLAKQSFKDFEIIIIDNGSSDHSKEFVNKNYPKITFIEMGKNCGFSMAVNHGIKLSKGKYVVLLNNDTIAEENWLKCLLNTIESDEKIFSVSSKMIQFNNRDLIDDSGDSLNILGLAWQLGHGFKKEKCNSYKKVFSSCAGAAIYRKDLFEKIGYFDKKFFAYLEDVDIGYRANIYGYINIYCPYAKIYHIGSATSGTGYSDFKVFLTSRNNTYLIYKNMPILQLLLNSPFLFIGFIFKYMIFSRLGYSKSYIEGTIEGIKTLRKIEKTHFKFKNIKNYIKIQLGLVFDLFRYIFYKIQIRMNK
ncbi:glycosyltransferase family 2 protein [Tepidibacter formicigenes]|jgi:GT2 family glycosyltransferase|uniref:Glycosyltransferase, GT2 family n=1 Tax=Tepidibacter formicigenes DSM 15518 TaxID=1123349 RepID=A0A1M6QVR1_9FIRM|nr:glycosyltransferase family 2 protein [Tepidibacter formicigenes]SHK24203.1 Glycosyltransferase, GT2 family [Tepidibacter formicigenes DSM 15518]